jgi:hypothetical protein
LRLNAKKVHYRNWRPIIILFIHEIKERLPLVRFAEMLGQNSGLLTISRLLTPEDKDELSRRNEIAFEMQQDLQSEGLQALTEVNVVSDFKLGMNLIASSHGIAGIKTNTVVFGWSQYLEGKIQELQIINDLSSSGKNILLAHITKPFSKNAEKRIDIWWRGQDNNGDLMLLLSYLIKLNRKWSKAEINIFSITQSDKEKILMERHIEFSIKEARIDAKINVFTKIDKSELNMLLEKSKHADLVFLGLARESENFEKRIKVIDTIVAELKAVVFVQNNGMKNEIPVIFKKNI